jgi:hypothetical protein
MLNGPQIIRYQGLLTDRAGRLLVDGLHNATLQISLENGREVWSETFAVRTNGGVFSVKLGGGNHPLPPDLDLEGALVVTVTAEPDAPAVTGVSARSRTDAKDGRDAFALAASGTDPAASRPAVH